MARGCSAGSSSCFRSQSQTTEGGLICCHLAFITLAKRLLRSQVSERRVPPGRNKARIVMGVAMGSIKCSITWSAITTSTDASAQIETRNVVDDLEPKAILHFAHHARGDFHTADPSNRRVVPRREGNRRRSRLLREFRRRDVMYTAEKW